jgi:hypothetical protein
VPLGRSVIGEVKVGQILYVPYGPTPIATDHELYPAEQLQWIGENFDYRR